MLPSVIITVGYIIGIIWGLYLKVNIVPIIFLLFGGLILLSKKKVVNFKYKYSVIIIAIFAFISYTQIMYLENKFNTLYAENQEIEVQGIIISEGKIGNYTTSYTIKVESVNGDVRYKNTRLIMYVKSIEDLSYGKRVKFVRYI